MKVIQKLTLLFCIILLTTSTLWQDWNINPVPSSVITPPSGWIRAKNNSTAFDLSDRFNQYTYYLSGPAGPNVNCTISCGPRSFLTNENSKLICRRDKSPSFWNSTTLQSFPDTCFPDVKTSGLGCQNFQLALAYKGDCSKNKIPSSYGNVDCCYNQNIN